MPEVLDLQWIIGYVDYFIYIGLVLDLEIVPSVLPCFERFSSRSQWFCQLLSLNILTIGDYVHLSGNFYTLKNQEVVNEMIYCRP